MTVTPPILRARITSSYSQTHIQQSKRSQAEMQHHKQPIVTDIPTTANKLHNQNDVETSIQWIPGHCDIPGNDRADKLATQGTSKAQHDEHVSYTLHPSRSYKRSLGRFAITSGLVATLDGLLPANSKPDIPYQPSTETQSTSHCHISLQNTPCTAERPSTSHQERTPIKVCLLPRQW